MDEARPQVTDDEEATVSTTESVKQATKRAAATKLYEVDYVGNETFVMSSLNLLLQRSEEPIKNDEAKLSARGLHHRPRERHVKEFNSAHAVITNWQRRERKEKKAKISAQLVPPLYQRALTYERMKQFDLAANDYTMILGVGEDASAYFNRSGCYHALGDTVRALEDITKAISLDPSNFAYRSNKALLLRQQGQYFPEAINETMIGRAILTLPEFVKSQLAQNGGTGEILIAPSQLRKLKLPVDPVSAVLALPREERTPKALECVIDFLSRLKFFAPFVADNKLMQTIAGKVELTRHSDGDYIFEEGMKGEHFYMILDGEVSIVKTKKNEDGFVLSSTVLVKLFRGQTFGETALESAGGFRTAGAMASSQTGTALLSMHVDDYKQIILSAKLLLRGEVRLMLETSSAFQEFSNEALDSLAEKAVLRYFGTNKEIFKAGDPSKTLYIVKQGIVRITKEIKRVHVNDLTGAEKFNEPPGLWVLEKPFKEPGYGGPSSGGKDKNQLAASMGYTSGHFGAGAGAGKTLGMTVGVLASGQVFGELAVLCPGLPSPVTATSFTPVEIYCLDSEAVLAAGAKFSRSCMNSLNDGIAMHNPPAEKLAYFFREKYNNRKLEKNVLEALKF
jgi:CRP-like cAMP-binding protein